MLESKKITTKPGTEILLLDSNISDINKSTKYYRKGWQLLENIDELNCKKIVKRMPFDYSDRYMDYSPYLWHPNHFPTAKESLLSILKLNGFESNNIILFRQF